MNANQGDEGPMSMEEATPEQIMSAIFANMVMQNAQMAAMFLGRVPHPQTGERVQDLEGAQMFIDQLEMLEAKTKGNLSKEEANLLKQSLMSARMAFVEAVRSGAPAKPETSPAPPAETSPAPEPKTVQPPESTATPDAESKVKFSKKY